QDEPVQLRLAGARCADLATHSGGAMYDLHLWLSDSAREGRITGTAWYDTGRFDEPLVRGLVERYTSLVRRLVETPDVPLREFTVATPAELAQLDAWNDTARAWD